MKVSKAEKVSVCPNKRLIGFASVELDEQLLLNSIAVHSRRDGRSYRLIYTNRLSGTSIFTFVHPIAPSLSKEIERQALVRAAETFEV